MKRHVEWVCHKCLREQDVLDRKCWACKIVRDNQTALWREWRTTIKTRRAGKRPWRISR